MGVHWWTVCLKTTPYRLTGTRLPGNTVALLPWCQPKMVNKRTDKCKCDGMGSRC